MEGKPYILVHFAQFMWEIIGQYETLEAATARAQSCNVQGSMTIYTYHSTVSAMHELPNADS